MDNNNYYLEQIKSPKWQKRRLEILNRDNFTYNKLHPAECGIFERLIKRRADIGMDEIQ